MADLRAIETVPLPKPARGKTPVDHRGKRFGRLLVLAYVGRRASARRPECGSSIWRCICDCGKEHRATSHTLTRGQVQSCGCLGRSRLKYGGENALPVGQSAFNQLFYSYRKSARQRGHSFDLTAQEFRDLTERDCYYCGAPPALKFRAAQGTNGDYIGNGVDRIDNGRGYEKGNVRPCCKQCNVAKGTLTDLEFNAWIRRAFVHSRRFDDLAVLQYAEAAARFEHGERG